MENKVYPFASGSEYTASYAISSSFATSASLLSYVATASYAGTVLFPETGDDAAIDICVITYEQYLQILSGSYYEVC
jgi:hypothetical protein